MSEKIEDKKRKFYDNSFGSYDLGLNKIKIITNFKNEETFVLEFSKSFEYKNNKIFNNYSMYIPKTNEMNFTVEQNGDIEELIFKNGLKLKPKGFYHLKNINQQVQLFSKKDNTNGFKINLKYNPNSFLIEEIQKDENNNPVRNEKRKEVSFNSNFISKNIKELDNSIIVNGFRGIGDDKNINVSIYINKSDVKSFDLDKQEINLNNGTIKPNQKIIYNSESSPRYILSEDGKYLSESIFLKNFTVATKDLKIAEDKSNKVEKENTSLQEQTSQQEQRVKSQPKPKDIIPF